MSFNYDLTGIRNHKSLYEIDQESLGIKLKEIPRGLIFLIPSLGINSVTHENYIQVFNRIKILESLKGELIRKKGKPYKVKESDLIKIIGIKTNSVYLNRYEFIDSILSKEQL